ncbi:MAG: energy transducer TonB [Deltaproteobacteria bacterium]|nr:energy transducer TonB [Deltaproteobacteria bacterium]
MTGRRQISWLGAVLAALAVNAVVFGWVPILSQGERQVNLKEHPGQAVYLTKYQPPPRPEPQVKKPLPQPQEPPPQRRLKLDQKPVQAKKPRLDLKAPRLSFELNPRLATGLAVAPVPQARPDLPSEFEMGQVDQAPQVIRRVPPLYPYAARRRGLAGEVVVRFLVDVEGQVQKLTIVKANPRGVFEQSVQQAVSKWRFKPGRHQGQPVPTWVVVPIKFQLKG